MTGAGPPAGQPGGGGKQSRRDVISWLPSFLPLLPPALPRVSQILFWCHFSSSSSFSSFSYYRYSISSTFSTSRKTASARRLYVSGSHSEESMLKQVRKGEKKKGRHRHRRACAPRIEKAYLWPQQHGQRGISRGERTTRPTRCPTAHPTAHPQPSLFFNLISSL